MAVPFLTTIDDLTAPELSQGGPLHIDDDALRLDGGGHIDHGHFAGIQLSWSAHLQSAPSAFGIWLLKPPVYAVNLHAELRGKDGSRIRLRARVDDLAMVQGIPHMALSDAREVSLDDLRAAIGLSLQSGGHLVRWDEGAVGHVEPPRAERREASPLSLLIFLLSGWQQGIWLVFLFTGMFALGFGAHSEMVTNAHWWGSEGTRVTPVEVTRVEDTGSSANGRSIQRVEYSFVAHDGGRYRGESYTDLSHVPSKYVDDYACWDDELGEFDLCYAAYRADNPAVSDFLMQGHRQALWGYWAGLTLLFPLVFGLIGLFGIRAAARRRWHLLYGQTSHAALIDHQTLTGNKGGTRHRLTFAWQSPDGIDRTLELEVLDPDKFLDEELEPITYSPIDFARAELVDHVDGLELNRESGEVRLRGHWKWCVLPLLALAITGYALGRFIPPGGW